MEARTERFLFLPVCSPPRKEGRRRSAERAGMSPGRCGRVASEGTTRGTFKEGLSHKGNYPASCGFSVGWASLIGIRGTLIPSHTCHSLLSLTSLPLAHHPNQRPTSFIPCSSLTLTHSFKEHRGFARTCASCGGELGGHWTPWGSCVHRGQR